MRWQADWPAFDDSQDRIALVPVERTPESAGAADPAEW
jgi:hypothetical protein